MVACGSRVLCQILLPNGVVDSFYKMLFSLLNVVLNHGAQWYVLWFSQDMKAFPVVV